ncbi:PQQ-binding-like beta-propeller repeat protein [Halobaculum limi]|uniref:outer membrane protein assembly factor BamB family protein n=1 Tax=Halobaculum limi TaxID=3031916 RepID=UPI002404EFF8|nr:PQQ-binding-like beta-propeller repeat protein [Halobaculum sp. YSMS11]
MPSRRDTLRGLGSLGAVGLAATAGCLGAGPGSYDGVSPGDDADTDWPRPRHDARATGYAPDAAAPRTGATVSWRRQTFLPRPPVVADGLVLRTAAGVGITAYDVDSGEERWSYEPDEHPTVGAPAVHDGVAYVPMREGLTAVRLADGEELWRGPSATPEATPVLTDDGDYVFGGGEDGHVYQLDPATGEVTWEADVFGTVQTLSLKRFLFVGTRGGEVYAFGDRFDPLEAWRLRFDGMVEAVTAHSNGPTVALFGGPLTNLTDNAGVGSVQWTAPAARANTAPVLVGSWLVSAGYDTVSTTRGYDGKRAWGLNGRFDRCDPVAAGDTLYLGDTDGVHAISLSGGVGAGGYRVGARRWSMSLGGPVGGLAVASGSLVATVRGGDQHEVVVLDPVDD